MSHKTERLLPKKTHDQMISEWMSDPAFKLEYNALDDEYQKISSSLTN